MEYSKKFWFFLESHVYVNLTYKCYLMAMAMVMAMVTAMVATFNIISSFLPGGDFPPGYYYKHHIFDNT